jgi:hypothetical protein
MTAQPGPPPLPARPTTTVDGPVPRRRPAALAEQLGTLVLPRLKG